MAKVKGDAKALRRKLDDVVRSAKLATSVKIGFPEGATYPDGASLPVVAAVNEFGRPEKNQPPRPFFRRMVSAKRGEWPAAIAGLLRTNDFDVKLTLEQTGDAVAGQLRESINELVDPPLSPKTIARKGFDKPLIDTSQLVKSATFEVE